MPARTLLVSAMLSLFALPAHAYIDPGAGSLALQLILGGLAGAFVTLKLFWRRIRSRGGASASDVPPDPAAPEE